MIATRVTAVAALAAAALGLAGCGGDASGALRPLDGGATIAPQPDTSGDDGARRGGTSSTSTRTDPRAQGLDITLGEWAVTPEAKTVRPGPVTLVISNRGTMSHGFEMEADGDHSGPGGGEGFKMETGTIDPGETVRVRVDLAPGVYEIECFIDGHDDMGMENILRVERGAPLVAGASDDDAGIAIEGFAFSPRTLEVTAGTEVTWINRDPTEHTVTSDEPGFDSEPLQQGDEFAARIDEPGTYTYRCAIHPEMTARLSVSK